MSPFIVIQPTKRILLPSDPAALHCSSSSVLIPLDALLEFSAQSGCRCVILVTFKMHFLRLVSALTTICLHVQEVITQPKVTDTNTKVTYYGSSADGVEQFENILFGQDTSGRNRFAPPLPFAYPPGSMVLANAPGNACPQPVIPVAGFEFLFSNVTRQTEDCLNLRIARPAGTHSQSRLPVMVWIYGGMSLGTPSIIIITHHA